MTKRIAHFGGAKMAPIAGLLPKNIAASIGRVVTRHAYLTWLQGRIVDALLGISIKQGRVAVRVPRPNEYKNVLTALLQFHQTYPNTNLSDYATALDNAERARNRVAHSIYLIDGDRLLIQLVEGSWELNQDVHKVSRKLQPETVPLTAEFLAEQRRCVERAIRMTLNLKSRTETALAASNEKRRIQPEWDRRRPRS